jgi:hypothetical protein
MTQTDATYDAALTRGFSPDSAPLLCTPTKQNKPQIPIAGSQKIMSAAAPQMRTAMMKPFSMIVSSRFHAGSMKRNHRSGIE